MTGDQHYARRHGFRSSGNTAFDSYKAETLRRLMDEQEAFENFLERLRAAKDKSEFDQFMEELADATREAAVKAAEDMVEDAETLDDPEKDKK
jgi:Xaa-Pro aminopeptidase